MVEISLNFVFIQHFRVKFTVPQEHVLKERSDVLGVVARDDSIEVTEGTTAVPNTSIGISHIQTTNELSSID